VAKNKSARLICCSFIAALHIIFASGLGQMLNRSLHRIIYNTKSMIYEILATLQNLARPLQSIPQCTRLSWILPFSLQSTRVAGWLSSETIFVKGVGG
jgi:hypothetical protein